MASFEDNFTHNPQNSQWIIELTSSQLFSKLFDAQNYVTKQVHDEMGSLFLTRFLRNCLSWKVSIVDFLSNYLHNNLLDSFFS